MTKTVLHIDASVRLDGSVSRDISQRIVDRLAPETVIRRDLRDALPLIDENWVNANYTPADQRSPAQVETLSLSNALLGELRAADTVVIGAPVYNFTIPAGLKAWIDLIARVGETFQYTESGPVGLLEGKRAIIAVASGGVPVGSPADFLTGYLRHVLGFVGITNVDIVAADQVVADQDAAVGRATAAIAELTA